MICDRPSDSPWVFVIGVWQCPVELACLMIVLFEKGDVHRCNFAVMDACKVPAVSAETS